MAFGLIVESMVAILLATTIGYCIILNQRLKRLHSDRDQLRKMVADLVQATSLANAAVTELKTAAVEADAVLQARLQEAEKFGVEIANHVNAGQQIMDKIGAPQRSPVSRRSAAGCRSSPACPSSPPSGRSLMPGTPRRSASTR